MSHDRFMVDWPRMKRLIDRELRRRLLVGIAIGLILGLLLGRVAFAAPRPAPEPIVSDLRPLVVPGRTEAPQPTMPSRTREGGPATMRDPDQGGGASPSPSPVAASAQPTDAPTPVPSAGLSAHASSSPGRAALTASLTWYCNADRSRARLSACRIGYPDRAGVLDLFAATSKSLARAGWRIGKLVTVCLGPDCVTARVVDECGTCPGYAVDLYADAFAAIAWLGSGRLPAVVVR